MKVLIIEDEPIIAKRLCLQIERVRPGTNVAGIAENISDGIVLLEENPDVDIVFSDIRLSDGFSFSIFDSVETNAFIVFTTAYDEYALKAFDYNCIDYLVKPVTDKDLADAFERFERNLLGTHSSQASLLSANSEVFYRSRIKVQVGTSTMIVPVEEVGYFGYNLEVVNAYLMDGTRGMSGESLASLESSLDPRFFFRVNRQYIVRLNMVGSISSTAGRGKIISLREPFKDVRIKASASSVREIKSLLGL